MLYVISASPFYTVFIATFSVYIILWLLHKFSNICKPEEAWYGQPKYCYKKHYSLIVLNQLCSSLWTSRSYLNYTQFVSGVPLSQWFGPVSPGRSGRDTQNITDPASENRFGWFLTRVGTPLYSLYTTGMCRWTGYGFSPLCPKGYMISFVFVNRVFPARLIWFSRWILFVLQVHKSNDYDVPCSLAIANKWL